VRLTVPTVRRDGLTCAGRLLDVAAFVRRARASHRSLLCSSRRSATLGTFRGARRCQRLVRAQALLHDEVVRPEPQLRRECAQRGVAGPPERGGARAAVLAGAAAHPRRRTTHGPDPAPHRARAQPAARRHPDRQRRHRRPDHSAHRGSSGHSSRLSGRPAAPGDHAAPGLTSTNSLSRPLESVGTRPVKADQAFLQVTGPVRLDHVPTNCGTRAARRHHPAPSASRNRHLADQRHCRPDEHGHRSGT
jgi:hypothetical protein